MALTTDVERNDWRPDRRLAGFVTLAEALPEGSSGGIAVTIRA